MRVGGAYRIDDIEFPAPVTEWQDQVLGARLDGFPVLNSYRLHRWTWPGAGLEGCVMQQLLELFYQQQSQGVQLSELETDPFDASTAESNYGTVVYRDFIIKSVQPLRRDLPHYSDPEVIFEVYVG